MSLPDTLPPAYMLYVVYVGDEVHSLSIIHERIWCSIFGKCVSFSLFASLS